MSDIPQYSQLVLNVCETLQEEVIALFDQTRHSLASGSAAEDKDSMETDDCSRPRHKDQRDGVRDRPGKLAVLPTCFHKDELLPTLCQALGGLVNKTDRHCACGGHSPAEEVGQSDCAEERRESILASLGGVKQGQDAVPRRPLGSDLKHW